MTQARARLPRVFGVTSLMIEYHKGDEEVLNTAKKAIINEWILTNGTVCKRAYSIMDLSRFLDIAPKEIQEIMADKLLSSRIISEDNSKAMADQLMSATIAWALEDRMDVQQQLQLLRESQGDSYKPFVTAEMNKALKLKLESSTSLQSLVRGFTGGGNINIFQQNNVQNNVQNITYEDVLERIQISNQEMVDQVSPLKVMESYSKDSIPEVCALKQGDIDTSQEGLGVIDHTLMAIANQQSPKGLEEDLHAVRREIELRINTGDDPELDTY